MFFLLDNIFFMYLICKILKKIGILKIKKGGLPMGCPNISYAEMCYEADRLIRKKKKIDKEIGRR